MLTVPTKWLPLFKSPLIGWGGKLRMAMEPFIKARRDGVDEPLGRFIERRLGKECLDRIAEPLLGGIYAGDIHAAQHARSTFPQLVELRRVQHRSLDARRHGADDARPAARPRSRERHRRARSSRCSAAWAS
jgi:protoporphyrinogen oxidase